MCMKIISLFTSIEHLEVNYFAVGKNASSPSMGTIIGIASFYKYVIYVQNFKHVWTFLISYYFSGKIA